MHRRYLISLVLLFFLILFPVTNLWSATGTWNRQTVDWSEQSIGFYTSLALDSSGRPHISYCGQMESFPVRYTELKYAFRIGSGWITQTVDPVATSYSSLALDSADRPHISYCNISSPSGGWGRQIGVLKHAFWNGLNWNLQTIDNAACKFSSLALSSSNLPRISYSSGNYLKLAYWNGSNWNTTTVDSEGGRTAIALDGHGWPCIAYGENQLKYARWNGSEWNIQTIDSRVPRSISIALDSIDRPHITYHDYHDFCEIKYASLDGSIWNIQTIGNTAPEHWESWSSLDLDSHGCPHIVYSFFISFVSNALAYTHWNGNQWEVELMTTNGNWGGAAWRGPYCSLVLDSSDVPHISFYRQYYDPSPLYTKYKRFDYSSDWTGTLDYAVRVEEYSIRKGADFDGDGTDDIGIFRPNNGLWAVKGITRAYFGAQSDIPVPGDYHGDHTTRAAMTVFRPNTGLWAVRGLTRLYFGSSQDIPVPGNYTGSLPARNTDMAVFNNSVGLWAIRGFTRCYFGESGDEPL